MTVYVLEITLQSPLTPASGEDRVGLVDRDVAFDDLGLPILPGKRLKGLWREAYCDVVDAWELCGKSDIPSADAIFGKVGQKSDPKGTYMHVSSAELKEASSLKPWLQYLQHPPDAKLSIEDIIQHFTTVRAQTAIDRLTGAAGENTLRLTRTVQVGRVFRAQVSFVNPPDDEVIKGLARGAAALQYMGTSRTRGFGKVRCRLLIPDVECDLTEYVLNHDALPSLAGGSPLTSTGPATRPKTSHSSSLHILRYRLTLKEPVVIPAADGDPNTVATRQNVPGSHLWGIAAWNYLHRSGHTATHPDFCRLFLDKKLRFLTAYPEALDDGSKKRLIPIPHSIRKFKEDDNLVDLAESLTDDEKRKPKERLDSRYGRLDTGILKTHAVKTERNYHHARAKDRRKGRALGAGTRDGGTFFTYEAIQKQQIFHGAVLGAAADLMELKKWLKGGDLIGLGRSRSAQYSTAKFEWFGNIMELNERTEWNGFDELETPPDLGNHLIITTMSPLLGVNVQGHPTACFPECELAEILDLDTSDLKLLRSYTRTELVGGYHTHLRLPRQQWPTIAAGSVFIFHIPPASDEEACSLREKRLLQLEHDGLGLRKGEGYGRVAVNRQGGQPRLTDTPEESLEDVSPEPPSGEPNEDILNLLCSVVRTRCLSEMQQIVVPVATEVVEIPNSVLGQLRLFLQQNSFVENWDAFAENLHNLRDSAKDILTKNEIDTSNLGISDLKSPLTLLRLFEEVWNTHVKEFEDRWGDEAHAKMIEMLDSKHKANMCKAFLGQLLTTLYRQSRP